MKYLSTFSGIGGFELGINKAYEKLYNSRNITRELQTQRELSPKGESNQSKDSEVFINSNESSPLVSPTCVGYSEIDKYAIQIYEKQFTKRFPYCSDCWEQKKTKRELPTEGESIRCEGGESCINCGKSASLLFNIKPKNYGDITKINAKELPDFDLFVGGFPCQAFSIAGKRGGFDDTRGTLFFDCARILKEKQPRNFILENVKGLLSHDNGRTFKTIINTLTELGYCVEWQVLNAKNFGVPQNRERVFIVGHLGGIPERKVFPIGQNDKENIKSRQVCTSATVSTRTGSTAGGQQFISQLNNPTHSNDRVYGTDGLSPTLNTIQGGNRQPFIPENSRIRRLTPLECERLMGYPDNWTEGLSDTQRYKTLGNGIVSNVVAEVVKRLW